MQALVLLGVKTGNIKEALLNEGLEERVGMPVVEVLFCKIAENVGNPNVVKGGMGEETEEFFEEMVGKTT
ncbi:MAG: hypothetical protein F6K24_45950 [Okeania sp. SIO2D1]|nr:hypothetical protein [Okeania sp. SIO2D1]